MRVNHNDLSFALFRSRYADGFHQHLIENPVSSQRYSCIWLFLKLSFLIFLSVIMVFTCKWALAENKTGDSIDALSYLNMPPRPRTTFEKFLPLAVAGDDKVQNFLGFMFFYGDGVEQNFEAAHKWFHSAAEQGNVLAQQNLGLLHSRANPVVPRYLENENEAKMWFEIVARNIGGGLSKIKMGTNQYSFDKDNWDLQKGELEIGEKIYRTFCTGCHGVDGRAVFGKTPSFARGDTLVKNNRDLLYSLKNGKGIMPPWRETLSDELLTSVLVYIRSRFPNADLEGGISTSGSQNSPKKSDRKMEGEKLFLKFCAGCHGFNGIAFYVNSPSFALGQRMHKSDGQLSQSIRNGKGQMPGWGFFLNARQIGSILVFIRSLQDVFKKGITKNKQFSPDLYFRFRPFGEMSDDWIGSDPIGVVPRPSSRR